MNELFNSQLEVVPLQHVAGRYLFKILILMGEKMTKSNTATLNFGDFPNLVLMTFLCRIASFIHAVW